jgi:hypothetical protein
MSRLLGWLFFATLTGIMLLQLRGLNAPLITDATPWGIVSYELAFTAERARQMLEAWRLAGATDAARVSLGVDVGFFLVAYPWFLRSTIGTLRELRWTPGPGADAAGARLAGLVLLCIPLDGLENLLLWQMLEGGPSTAAALTAGVAAVAKFALVLAAALWSLWVVGHRVGGARGSR